LTIKEISTSRRLAWQLEKMPSAAAAGSAVTYHLIRQAITDRCCLTGSYDGRIRHFAPHAIGQGEDGQANVLAFQYAGQSMTDLPPGGEWRCFRVDGLSGVRRNDDRWHSRRNYSRRPHSCVARIDIAVPM